MLKTRLDFLEDSMLLQSPPANFSLKAAEVAAILPFISHKILLLQRLPTHPQANLWCSPGGKLNKGEKPIEAAVRELEEETGILIHPNALIDLGKFYVCYPNGDFIVNLFKVQLDENDVTIQIKNTEHQAYCLCSLKEAKLLSLTPGLNEYFDLVMHAAKDRQLVNINVNAILIDW